MVKPAPLPSGETAPAGAFPARSCHEQWRKTVRWTLGFALPVLAGSALLSGWWAGKLATRWELQKTLQASVMAARVVDEAWFGHHPAAPPGDQRAEWLRNTARRLSQSLPGQPPVRFWVPAGQGMKEIGEWVESRPAATDSLPAVQEVLQEKLPRMVFWAPSGGTSLAASVLTPVLAANDGTALAVLETGVYSTQLEAVRRQFQALGGAVSGVAGLVLLGVLLALLYRHHLNRQLSSLNYALADELAQHQAADAKVHKLSRALENCPVAVLITDANGRIEYVNPKFTELSGFTAAEAVGQNPRILKSGLMPPKVYEGLWHSLATQGQWVGELLNRRKDGTLFWQMSHIAALKDSQGRIANYVAAMEDITLRKQTQEELQAAKIAAEEAARAKSEFLANMSHEIRTPMNGVIGFTSLLEHTQLSPEQKDLVNNIRTSSEALLLLLNDILDYSKIEAGKLDLHPEDFHLADCLREVLQVVTPKAAQKGLNLAASLAPGVPLWVRGDVLRLRQVLLNLTGNAVKFTSHGEAVVHVNPGDPADPVPTANPAPVLHFQVRDTGPGIPEEHRARLFQKFSQGDGSVTRRHGGTGLGLAISKRLVELMGGRIWVESQVNEGSTFHFTVTLQPPTTPAPAAEPPPSLDGRSLLLLCGNYTHRLLIEAAARPLRLTLHKAATVDRAWHLLQTLPPPDLILIEPWGTPAQLREFLSEVRQTVPTARLAVLTYREWELQHLQPLRLPLAGVLHKPLFSHDLPRQLAGLFQNSPQVKESAAPGAVLDGTLAARLPLKILLVDDNPVNLQVGNGVLTKLGYCADMAADGIEALNALGQKVYDLVLLDVQMPHLDGLEVARRVQHLPEAQRPVLIAVTAGAMQGDRERCLEAGMNDYLSKPFRPAQIQQMIEKWYPVIADRRPALRQKQSAPPGLPPSAPPPSAPSAPPPPPASCPPQEEAPVDFERLAEVNNDSEEGMAEMAHLFEEQADELLGAIAPAMSRKDASAIKASAHKLRGSCGACGITAMVAPLAALERAALAGDWEAAGSLWQEVQQQYRRVQACLRQRFKYNPLPA